MAKRETDTERAQRMLTEYGRERSIELLRLSIATSRALRCRMPVSRKPSIDSAIAADQHLITLIESLPDTRVPYVEVDQETAHDVTQRAQRSFRVF